MIPWRTAKSLLKLRDQWKAAHPGAANPGFIGDAEHASRTSDHNPWVDDPASNVNVVTAGDFYHQPKIGADAGKLAEALKAAKDPRVKYVIWNRRIWSLARDYEGWRPYNGANPHTGHVHVSVSSSKSRYDNTSAWKITTTPPKGTKPVTVTDPEDVDEYGAHVHAKAAAQSVRAALSRVEAEGQTIPEPPTVTGSGDAYFAHYWAKYAAARAARLDERLAELGYPK